MPAGISVEVAEDVTTVTITSEEAITVAITADTTDVSVSAIPPVTSATDIVNTAYGTITSTTVQASLEQLADQFFRQSATPSGTNLAEGDLWYDTANEELRVYREISAGSYEWQALVSGGYISGEASLMDKLDGGLF